MEGGKQSQMGDLRLGMAEKFSLEHNKFGVPGASGVEISGRRPLSIQVWARQGWWG